MRPDNLRRQSTLREVRPVQSHDEVGAAGFGALPERRIVWIGLRFDGPARRNHFGRLSQQVHDSSDERPADSTASQHLDVLVENSRADEPRKGILLSPSAQELRAWIRGGLVGSEASDTGDED